MKVCVSYVYWMLLFTSVVSSALLFLIVASESVQNNKFIGPDRNQGFIQEENVTNIKNLQDQSRSETDAKSDIKIPSPLKTKLKEETFQDNESSPPKNVDIPNKNGEPEILEKIEIINEKLTQPPNLSQGTSDSQEPVVLTLVKTPASLSNLSSGRSSFRSKSARSEGNTSLRSNEDEDVEEENDPSSSSPGNLVRVSKILEANESASNETEGKVYNEPDSDDVVVVVRAEQKRATSVRDEVKKEVEREKESDSPEEIYHEDLEVEMAEIDTRSQELSKNPTTAPELNDSAARARLTGSADDSTAAIIDSLVTGGPSEPHEDIPSFNEWAQKRLEEAEKKKTHPNASVQTANGSPGRSVGSMRMRSKNYASPDCGAKIVAANPESRSARSVLATTRDEYMLNTCTSRVWFVVELCEAIQAKKIELANFELFSSSPKDLSVYVSDRFPTRDWSIVGQFTARDERDVQSFTLQPQLFGKFIKVELHSHYGSEHFCPISLFRAYGTSEFEVLETETESAGHTDGRRREISPGGQIAAGSEADSDDEDDDESAFEDEDGSKNEPPPVHLFGSARDAVLSIVKKAAEVLVKSEDLTSTNNITKIQESISGDVLEDATLNDCTTPIYNVACRDCNDDRFARVFQLISCREHYLESLLSTDFVHDTIAKSHLCISSSGLDFIYDSEACTDRSKASDDRHSETTNYYLQAQFLSSLFTPDYIIALCNVLAAREQRLFVNASHQEQKVADGTPNKTKTEQNNQMPLATKTERLMSTLATETSTISSSNKAKAEEPVIKLKFEATTESQMSNENLISQIKPTQTTASNGETKRQPSTVNIAFKSQHPEETKIHQTETTTDLPVPIVTKRSSSSSQKISPGTQEMASSSTISQEVPATVTQNVENSQGLNDRNISVGNGETDIKNEEETDAKIKTEPVEQEPKVAQDQLNFEGFDFKDLDVEGLQNNGGIKNDASVTQQSTSATTPQQKESVFLRLSNRIKALERNMSLSSQYLEELSRRYKKQVEEMQRSLERAMTAMNEESRKGEEREYKRLEEVNALREQIGTLTKALDDLVFERNSWTISFSSLMQHAVFVLVDVVIVMLILSYCKRTDDDFDYYEEEAEPEERNIVIRPKKGKSYEIVKQNYSQLSRKPKKRRPSEIASQVSGTYDQLMIEDSTTANQQSKKDKKKKRKKESIILRTSSIKETSSSSRGNTNSEDIATASMPPLRSSSANDALYLSNYRNGSEFANLGSQRQARPESAPDTSITYFRDQQAEHLQYDDNKVQILANNMNNGESANEQEEQANNSKELNSSTSFEDDVFEQGESSTSNIHTKLEKVSSPSFMRTALGSRSKRISFSGSSKKQYQSLDESTMKPLERRGDDKIDLLSKLETINGPGDEFSNGRATNGHVEESDESRSSSVTPTTGWCKKEKKSNGLKKMVRKFF